MEFKKKQTIYLQIAKQLTDKILEGAYMEEQKVPSIRALAVDLQVNPNTVQRTYEHLQHEEIIFTQRGRGYFVCKGALKKIKAKRKSDLINNDLPQLFEAMKLLDIPIEEVVSKYESSKKN